MKNVLERGRFTKKQYVWGIWIKGGGAWAVTDLRGGLTKKRGCFLGRGTIDTQMHTM